MRSSSPDRIPAAIRYARMMPERGVIVGATRLFGRVWRLYVAYVVVFLCHLHRDRRIRRARYAASDSHLRIQPGRPLADHPILTLRWSTCFCPMHCRTLDMLQPLDRAGWRPCRPVLWPHAARAHAERWGIGRAVCRGPALRMEPAILSGWLMDLQPALLAVAVCARRVERARRGGDVAQDLRVASPGF